MRDRASTDGPQLIRGADKRVFHSLDALRGIAAITVVMLHYNSYFEPLSPSHGYLAVDLFFAMSGVVLEKAYAKRFIGGMNLREFLQIRLIRLYPLYLLGLLIAVATAFIGMHGHNAMGWQAQTLAVSALLSLFFIPSHSQVFYDQLFPLNRPTWSLFFELLVNIAYAATWRRLTVRRLLVTCSILAPALVYAAFRNGDLNLGWGWSPGHIATGCIRAAYGFAAGVVIARVGPKRHFRNFGLFAVLVATCVAVLFLPAPASIAPVSDLICVLVVLPALTYAGTVVEPPRYLTGVASLFGVASYAIYVLHVPVLQLWQSISGHFGLNALVIDAPYVGLGLIVIIIGKGWLVDRIYDVPIRRALGGFRRQAPVDGSVAIPGTRSLD